MSQAKKIPAPLQAPPPLDLLSSQALSGQCLASGFMSRQLRTREDDEEPIWLEELAEVAELTVLALLGFGVLLLSAASVGSILGGLVSSYLFPEARFVANMSVDPDVKTSVAFFVELIARGTK